jgi:hypothetical protein
MTRSCTCFTGRCGSARLGVAGWGRVCIRGAAVGDGGRAPHVPGHGVGAGDGSRHAEAHTAAHASPPLRPPRPGVAVGPMHVARPRVSAQLRRGAAATLPAAARAAL